MSITQVVQGSGNTGNLTLHPSAHYNMVEITDLSSGPPYNYQIANLVAGVTYYVRVSAHNQCPDTLSGMLWLRCTSGFRTSICRSSESDTRSCESSKIRLVRQELQQAPPTLRRSPFRGISQLLMAVQW